MSDTIRQPLNRPGTTTLNEATFLGGILRKGELVDGWEIESKIPVTSGEAELYLARKDGLTGVIKYYRSPDFQPKDEIIATLKSWKHEDVIQLFETGHHNGLFFEAMEYAAGGALDSRDASGYRYLPLSEEQTVQMVREVTNAFLACHAAGIIHRDIKPANIYLRNTDGTDFVIGDFGISSQLDMEARLSSRMTQNLNRTEGYAAPEVYSGVIKNSVDYYALGITVWEVLTGELAFEGRNANHVSRDTIEGRIIEDLLSRAESKDMSERMKMLIRGLLTHQHDKRWGYAEVQDWLAGKDVPVYSQIPETRVEPYSFEGQKYTNLAKVAEALLANPEAGMKHLYRGLIERWLATFNQDLAIKVGDIRENLGESAQDKALRQVALILNPAQPFVTEGNHEIHNLAEFKALIETDSDALIDHIRDSDDALWDFFEAWGYGEIAKDLKKLASIDKQGAQKKQRLANAIQIALSGDALKPFTGSKFAEMDLGSLSQLASLPKEVQKKFLLEFDNRNGLLAVWYETLTGKAIPEEWGENPIPSWEDVVAWSQGKAATGDLRFQTVKNQVAPFVRKQQFSTIAESTKSEFYASLVAKAGPFSATLLEKEIEKQQDTYEKEKASLAEKKRKEEERLEQENQERVRQEEFRRAKAAETQRLENVRREQDRQELLKQEGIRQEKAAEKLRFEKEEEKRKAREAIVKLKRQSRMKVRTLIHTLISILVSSGLAALGAWVLLSFSPPIESPFASTSWLSWAPGWFQGDVWRNWTIVVVAVIGAILGVALGGGFLGAVGGLIVGALVGWGLFYVFGFAIRAIIWVVLLIPNAFILLFFLVLALGKWLLFGLPILLGAVSAFSVLYSFVSLIVQIFLKPENYREVTILIRKTGGVYGLLAGLASKKKISIN